MRDYDAWLESPYQERYAASDAYEAACEAAERQGISVEQYLEDAYEDAAELAAERRAERRAEEAEDRYEREVW